MFSFHTNTLYCQIESKKQSRYYLVFLFLMKSIGKPLFNSSRHIDDNYYIKFTLFIAEAKIYFNTHTMKSNVMKKCLKY